MRNCDAARALVGLHAQVLHPGGRGGAGTTTYHEDRSFAASYGRARYGTPVGLFTYYQPGGDREPEEVTAEDDGELFWCEVARQLR